MSPLSPGSTIGMLGGGQLGRLLAIEAARLGFDVHVYCPEARSPAARVAAFETVAAYDDAAALKAFAGTCDVVTYEFENVPAATVAMIEAAGAPVRPGVKSLDVSQDRAVEKRFLNEIGIPTVDYHVIEDTRDLEKGLTAFGGRGILKTRRDGYDGKGQVRIDGEAGLAVARELAASVPCILEALAPFEREISVVVGRNETRTLAFEPSENEHQDGILKRSSAPAQISGTIRAEALEAGAKLADALGHIGVLALEYFVMPDGTLLANEFAPRVHNSGHWTPEACLTGQFEQHIRAVIGWPLASVDRLFDVEMDNLLGTEIESLPEGYKADDKIVSYGKKVARTGRKMAHVTRRIAPAGRS